MASRVLLVDDHRLVREALAQALCGEPSIEVVGQCGDAAGALELAARLKPDVVVLDIGLPEVSGVQVCRELQRAEYGTRVVALSAYTDRHFVTEMLRAGASAYVTKAAAGVELILAVQAVMEGRCYLSSEIAAAVVSQVHGGGAEPSAPRLGRRELDVLRLLAEGHRSAAIADHLRISVSTVEVHRRNIMRKLGLHTVAELTRYAVREGLVAL